MFTEETTLKLLTKWVFSTIFFCVCRNVCYMHVGYLWSPKFMSGYISSIVSLHYFLRQGISLSLKLAVLSRLVGQLTSDTPVSFPQC